VNEAGEDSRGSTVWAVFASGRAARTSVDYLIKSVKKGLPLSAEMISEVSPDFRTAAEHACGAFVSSARTAHRGAFEGAAPRLAAFSVHIEGERSGAFAGTSIGLAFAVALAAKVLGREPGPVAATGVLAETGGRGALSKSVSGFEGKLSAAEKVLGGGGVFLYPVSDDVELETETIERFQKKSIRLQSVSTVYEALEFLFPGWADELVKEREETVSTGQKLQAGVKTGSSRVRRTRMRAWLVLAACVLGAAALGLNERFKVVGGPGDAPSDESLVATSPASGVIEAAPLSEPQTPKRSELEPDFRIAGASVVEERIAQEFVERLKGKISLSGNISGTIRISGTREEMDRSGMQVDLMEFKTASGGEGGDPVTLSVEVSGPGGIENRIGEAAEALSAKAAAVLSGEEQVPEQATKKGFD
jgi:hypothetical protein